MEDRIDILARRLAEGASRRDILRWIGAGLTASLFGGLSARVSRAAAPPGGGAVGATCSDTQLTTCLQTVQAAYQDRRRNACPPLLAAAGRLQYTFCVNDALQKYEADRAACLGRYACAPGSQCVNGSCCRTGQLRCGDVCCGDQAPFCVNGTCSECRAGVAGDCAAGKTCCGGACLTVSSDPLNCGACGAPCAPAPNTSVVCTAGACVYTCKPGFAHCRGRAADGCEVNTAADSSNCGACGKVCPAGRGCSGGACVCTPGLTDCFGTCTNVSSDPNHCGRCGLGCVSVLHPDGNGGFTTQAAVCNRGQCGLTPDPQTDPQNCGAIGHVCPTFVGPNAVATCVKGVCGAACRGATTFGPGYTNCATIPGSVNCVDTTSDRNHCGGCGRGCYGGCRECINGVCVNLLEDAHNCGAVGFDCRIGGCCGGRCGVGFSTTFCFQGGAIGTCFNRGKKWSCDGVCI